MKLWIDVTSLPHVHFFRALVREMEKSGNDVIVTSREFGVMNEILERDGISYKSIGSHGGKDLESKLIKSSERVIELARHISREKPDVGLSKHSIECARVCFGLGIPSIMVIDHDTAAKQTRLTAPITDVVISPEATDSGRMERYGAKDVIRFRGVCEVSHFRDFKPSESVLENLGLSKDDRIVIARSEPMLSSHNFHKSVLYDVLGALKEEMPEVRIVFIPRDHDDGERFGNLGAIVPEKPIDTLSLYSFSNLMIGAGSCMNREAAVGGCPTISVCPDRLPGVDRFLVEKGLMHHSTDKEEILRKASEVLSGSGRERNVKKSEDFEDPYAVIKSAIEKLGKKSS